MPNTDESSQQESTEQKQNQIIYLEDISEYKIKKTKINENLEKESFEQNVMIYRERSFGLNMNMMHFHDGYEICLSLTDEVTCDIEDKSYVTNGGCIVVFNENDMHRMKVPEDVYYDRFVLQFNPLFIRDLCVLYPELTEQFANRKEGFEHCVPLNETRKKESLKLFDEMLGLYKNQKTDSQSLRLKFMLGGILLHINEIYSESPKNLSVKNYAYKEQLRSVMDYIKNNFEGDINLDRLAARFFISKQYLIKIFNKALGMTPYQYVTYCRIMKSKELLKQNIPVCEVSEMVGYGDTSNFISAFRKIVGLTPKQYTKSFKSAYDD